MANATEPESPLLISYMTLRKVVGFLGATLPFILSIGALLLFQTEMQESISGYYHTEVRDVFVGTLCAIGIFLLCYRGYDYRDWIACALAGGFAVGVALFPTTQAHDTLSTVGILHLVFAGLFFSTLAYISLCLFTKSDKQILGIKKRWRNRVYRTCGCAMVVCIILIGAVEIFELKITLEAYHPVFWLEAMAIFAFGFSWLTKGEAILGDEK